MPLYEYECPECGATLEKYFKVEEYKTQIKCYCCNGSMERIISKTSVKIFRSQFVGATLTDKDGNDVQQYVRNKQDLGDAIKRYNDTERASKTGKIAILE
jgi:putative FmdB family regulatory protein